ncbi:MAG: hypothetical protein AB1420_18920 [Bacillota bacterium]
MSLGFLLGLVGLAAFTAGLIWFGFYKIKNLSTKAPAILLFLSIILCITGYFLTPTGMANLRLIISSLIN